MSTGEAVQAVVAMHRLLRGLRRESTTGSLHPTQLIVLALLNQHDRMRTGELAERIPCSQPTATTAVAGLLDSGYVRRLPDPTDGRASHLECTEAGRRILESLAHSEAEVLTARLATMPEQEQEVLRAAIPVLTALADFSGQPEKTAS